MNDSNLKAMCEINKKFLDDIRTIYYKLCSKKKELIVIFPEKYYEFEEDIEVLEFSLYSVTRKVNHNKMNVLDMIKYLKKLEKKLDNIKESVNSMYERIPTHVPKANSDLIEKQLRETRKVIESLDSIEHLIEALGGFLVSTSIIEELNKKFAVEYNRLITIAKTQNEKIHREDYMYDLIKNQDYNFSYFDTSAYECNLLDYQGFDNYVVGLGILDGEFCKVYFEHGNKKIICEIDSKKITIPQNLIGNIKIKLFIKKGFIRELVETSMQLYC